MLRLSWVVGALAGCAASSAARVAPTTGDQLELTTDALSVTRTLEVDVPAGASSVPLPVPADVIAHPGLTIAAVHPASLDVVAPRAGHYALRIRYTTPGVAGAVAYTLTTTAAHDRARLVGAIEIASEVAWPRAELLVGTHALGAFAIAAGETRLELPAVGGEHPLDHVLVYDPIGTALDSATAEPVRTPRFGVDRPASTVVLEALALRRPARGWPAGPVQLLEQRPDGSVALASSGTLFGPQGSELPLGPAAGVTAHREQRQFSLDEDGRRLVEEVAITIDSTRATPAAIVIREHLYRGLTWSLVYYSAPTVLEAAQQIAMTATVPAHGHVVIGYVVAYTW